MAAAEAMDETASIGKEGFAATTETIDTEGIAGAEGASATLTLEGTRSLEDSSTLPLVGSGFDNGGGSQRGSEGYLRDSGSVASSQRGGLRRANSETSSVYSAGGSSRTSLSSMTRRRIYGGKKSPFKVPPPFDLPVVDQFGFPCALMNLMDEEHWDERHHLNGSENELKPQGLRVYFKKVENTKELKRALKYNCHLSNTKELVKAMSLPEINDRPRTKICPDAGPPMVPTRHVFGGTMKDRDGEERLWNDRWHKGIAIMNDNCHPDHREYFTQKSLFEDSPSQNYRRYMDQEVAFGVWKPIACKKKGQFLPLGGKMRGRSGTPIPGASE